MITRDRAVAILLEHNSERARHTIEMYVSCYLSYLEAQENIERNGTIVAHPRTGAPLENPYLKVRSAAMKDMRRCSGLKGQAELWAVGNEVLQDSGMGSEAT